MSTHRFAVLVTLSLTLAMIACAPAEETPNYTLELAAKASATTTVEVQTTTTAADVLFEAAALTDSELADSEFADVDTETGPDVPEVNTASFTLRHGERLDHFARWARLPVEVIAESSGLNLGRPYNAGIEIRVPVEGEALAALEIARDAHHTKRAEGYLASRGGAIGAEFVTVRTGDNATTIARDQQGLPVWLVETYNPSVDLDRLRPGQQLMIPILADIVVDAEDVDAPICLTPGTCPPGMLTD